MILERNTLVVPQFNTYFMIHFIAHRGLILWNALLVNCNVDNNVLQDGQVRRK